MSPAKRAPAKRASARGGIDLGGTKIQTVVVSARNKVLGEARRPTPTEGGPEDVAREMAAALREAAEAAGVETKSLVGIGVGSPGDADEETGVVSGARNLPGWEGSFPLADWLSKDLGTPVKVGNDVQVGVEGEFHLGAGKPYKTVLGATERMRLDAPGGGDPAELCGPGTGLDADGVARKSAVVARMLERNAPDPADPSESSEP